MIYFYFFIVVFLVVSFSLKVSDKAEWFEENTNISGIMVGVMLAAVTSLPELISGLTAVYLRQTSLATASLLGSNFFNFTIIGLVSLMYIYKKPLFHLKERTNAINAFVLVIYLYFIIDYILIKFFSIEIKTPGISLVSILIIITYIWSLVYLNSDDEQVVNKKVASKEEIKRNIILSLGYIVVLVISSSLLAKIAEQIMILTGLEASVVGAILIGVSTSLPEIVACASLMKNNQFDLAVSSVLASNMFNFFIFALVDIFEPEYIVNFMTFGVMKLVFLGVIDTLVLYIFLKNKGKKSTISHVAVSMALILNYGFYVFYWSRV